MRLCGEPYFYAVRLLGELHFYEMRPLAGELFLLNGYFFWLILRFFCEPCKNVLLKRKDCEPLTLNNMNPKITSLYHVLILNLQCAPYNDYKSNLPYVLLTDVCPDTIIPDAYNFAATSPYIAPAEALSYARGLLFWFCALSVHYCRLIEF